MNISVNLCPARKKQQEQVRDETTVNIELIFRNELEIPANPVRMLRHISARVDVPSLLLAFVYPRVSSACVSTHLWHLQLLSASRCCQSLVNDWNDRHLHNHLVYSLFHSRFTPCEHPIFFVCVKGD